MILIITDLRPSGPAANSSTMGQLRARRKAAKMLVAVVVMFASCYFPVHVLNILRYSKIKPSVVAFIEFNFLFIHPTDIQSISAKVK